MQKALVMRTKLASALLAASFVVAVATTASAEDPDPKFYIFLCFGQSNMEGFPGVEEQDKAEVERFKMLAAVDFPKLDRKKGEWYPAVPPVPGLDRPLPGRRLRPDPGRPPPEGRQGGRR